MRADDAVQDQLIAELELAAHAMEYDPYEPCPRCGQPGPASPRGADLT